MTFKRKDLQRGFEPDSSVYIQDEAAVGGKEQIDMAIDPPPDLLIEIEGSRSAIAKLPICAEMGIPEVWRFHGERVTIFRLADGQYTEVAASAMLPPLTSDVLTRFVVESRTLNRTAWLRAVREWAREQGEVTAAPR